MAEQPVAHKMIGGGHQVGMDREDRTPTRRSIRRVSVERAANGGHVVEHHFAQGGGKYHEPEQHVFGPGEHKKVAAHLAKALGFNKMANMAKVNASKAEPEPDGDDADE